MLAKAAILGVKGVPLPEIWEQLRRLDPSTLANSTLDQHIGLHADEVSTASSTRGEKRSRDSTALMPIKTLERSENARLIAGSTDLFDAFSSYVMKEIADSQHSTRNCGW